MLPALVVGLAVAAKVATLGWIGSVATSPTSQSSRENLLEHAANILSTFKEVDWYVDPKKIAAVTKDIGSLKQNTEKGWHTPEEFAAAVRISNFIFWSHAEGTVHGIKELSLNSFKSLQDILSGKLDSVADSLFGHPPKGDQDGNVRG